MSLKCLNTINCEQGAVRAVRFNVDGHYCITCGSDKKIKLWNPYRSVLLKTYGGHSDEVLDIASSYDSVHLVSCSKDKSVILWDVSTGKILQRYRKHAGSATCLCLNVQSNVAVSGSKDNTALCWDLRSNSSEPIQILPDAKDCVTSVKITTHEIFTSSLDGLVRTYDMRNCKVTSDFMDEAITSFCLSNYQQCMLLSCNNDTIRLIDKISGELLREYTGHNIQDIHAECAANFDYTWIISGSTTGDILFWDLVTANVVFKLLHNTNKIVHSLAVHPKKNVFLSASTNNIKLWGDQLEDE